jgi:hypothetical protein
MRMACQAKKRKLQLSEFARESSIAWERFRETRAFRMAGFSKEPGIRRSIAAMLHLQDAAGRIVGGHRDSERARDRLDGLSHPPDSIYWKARGREPYTEEERKEILQAEKNRIIRAARRALKRARRCGFPLTKRSIRSEKAARNAIGEGLHLLEAHGVIHHHTGAFSFKLFDSRLEVNGVPYEMWATCRYAGPPIPKGMAGKRQVMLFLSSISESLVSPIDSSIWERKINEATEVEDILKGARSTFPAGRFTDRLGSYAICRALRKLSKPSFAATYESLLQESVRSVAIHETMHLLSFSNDEISAFLDLDSHEPYPFPESPPAGEAYSERWAYLCAIAFGNPLIGLSHAPERYASLHDGSGREERAILGAITGAAGLPYHTNSLRRYHLERLMPLEEKAPELAKEILDGDFKGIFGKHFDDMVPTAEFERVRRHRFLTPGLRPMLAVVCGIPL